MNLCHTISNNFFNWKIILKFIGYLPIRNICSKNLLFDRINIFLLIYHRLTVEYFGIFIFSVATIFLVTS